MINQGLWRHISCIDVDFDVKKIIYRGPTYFKVKVSYVNRFNGIVYNPQPETVRIYKKDFHKWNKL